MFYTVCRYIYINKSAKKLIRMMNMKFRGMDTIGVVYSVIMELKLTLKKEKLKS